MVANDCQSGMNENSSISNDNNCKHSVTKKLALEIFRKYLDVYNIQKFKAMMDHQNSRWKTNHMMTRDFTPMSRMSVEKADNILRDRFKGWAPTNQSDTKLKIQVGHYSNEEELNKDDEIPDDIHRWIDGMPSPSHLDKALLHRRSYTPIFRYLGRLYEISAQFDIFFRALELRLESLPKESKRIADNLKKSIYMHPEFIRNELSYLIPFYRYSDVVRKERIENHKKGMGARDPLHLEISTKVRDSDEQTEEQMEDVKKTRKHPLINYLENKGEKGASEENLSSKITNVLTRYRLINQSYKMLKCCYPLYSFLFGNVLEESLLEESEEVLKKKNCKIIVKEYNLNSLRNNLRIDKKKTRIQAPELDKKQTAHLLNQIYSLKSCLEYLCSDRPVFSETYSTKNGRKENTGENSINCDRYFSLWMLIRHSDIFKISLMPHVDEKQSKGLFEGMREIDEFPRNFYSTLLFEKKVFFYYPTLTEEYNRIMEEQARKLFDEYKNLSVKQWLDISRQIKVLIMYGKSFSHFLYPTDWRQFICLVEDAGYKIPGFLLANKDNITKHLPDETRKAIIQTAKSSIGEKYTISDEEWNTLTNQAEEEILRYHNCLVYVMYVIVMSFCEKIDLDESYKCNPKKLQYYVEMYNRRKLLEEKSK